MKRIEFRTTRQYFGLGLGWSNGGDYQYYDYISVIIGCLVIQFNFNYPQDKIIKKHLTTKPHTVVQGNNTLVRDKRV